MARCLPRTLTQESLMFFKPAQITNDERVFRIIGFFDKILPNIEELTISEVGLTKFLVFCGPTKPILDSVSLAQWVILNTRIFMMLMQLGKLPSSTDL